MAKIEIEFYHSYCRNQRDQRDGDHEFITSLYKKKKNFDNSG